MSGEAASHIDVRVDGAVGILTMNRRERFNAMDPVMARDFRRAGLRLARDREVRAVILCGTGGVFSSGADLKYIRAEGDVHDFAYLKPNGATPNAGFGEWFKEILEYIHATIGEIRRSPKPWIAAVDGIAAAGGLGIAMCCDLVFASERAVLEWAYHKTGLTGAESSTFFVPKLVGLRKAMELILLNPRLSAREAKEFGLVNDVLPTDGFDDAVIGIAQRLAAGPTDAYGITKQLVNQALGVEHLPFHMDRELEELTRIADGPDFAEGIRAFLEKREPVFGAAAGSGAERA
ncbi:MAG TPA: enoyl-CoA hydratase-related protein [Gemmatimonadaceae bacterium]|nr:enoyl-CoA hydratase-related protein [Gemmatimonadaceae bacterium]